MSTQPGGGGARLKALSVSDGFHFPDNSKGALIDWASDAAFLPYRVKLSRTDINVDINVGICNMYAEELKTAGTQG